MTGFTNKEMLERIMKKQDFHDDKLDKIYSEQNSTKLEVTELKGEFKVMNGQVKQNKKDIKGIKAFTAKVAVWVGGAVSAVITALSNFVMLKGGN